MEAEDAAPAPRASLGELAEWFVRDIVVGSLAAYARRFVRTYASIWRHLCDAGSAFTESKVGERLAEVGGSAGDLLALVVVFAAVQIGWEKVRQTELGVVRRPFFVLNRARGERVRPKSPTKAIGAEGGEGRLARPALTQPALARRRVAAVRRAT